MVGDGTRLMGRGPTWYVVEEARLEGKTKMTAVMCPVDQEADPQTEVGMQGVYEDKLSGSALDKQEGRGHDWAEGGSRL